ncbi:MAG: hypothetical protein WCQ00_02005 [bacterium]
MQTQLTAEIFVLFFLKIVIGFVVVLFVMGLGKRFLALLRKKARAEFFAKQKYILLEITPPKDLQKTPQAMELFLGSLYQTGGDVTKFFSKHTNGSVRPWFSLEIISIGGHVRFFIWSRANFLDMIETQLYSQYPDIEIIDKTGNDYSTDVKWDPSNYQYWGCNFVKTAASHLPIKTYVSHGMVGGAKEESKVDPITPVIELLGSLKKDEQIWFQILIRAHTKETIKAGTRSEMVDWKYAAGIDLNKRMKRDVKIDKDKPINPALLQLTKAEKEAAEAIENSISKLPFDCGIRAFYLAKNDVFRPSMIAGINGSFRQYGSPNLNGFKTVGAPSPAKFKFMDKTGAKLLSQKQRIFGEYQHRSFFIPEYIPYGAKQKAFVMTTEELATIFHLPGSVVRTPTMARVQAKKVEPPANLPI